MNDLDSVRRRDSLYDPDPIPPSTRPETPAARDVADRRVDFPRETPERVAYFATLRAQPTATIAGGDPLKAKQEAIDKLRNDFAGPYTVNGQSVEAPVMFRMSISNAQEVASHAKELARACAKCGVAPSWILSGQADPSVVRKVTQALIEAGKLPPAPPGDLASRIRTMQWQFGIGIDCASFTRQAFQAANHRSMKSVGLDPHSEAFRGLDDNPHFEKFKNVVQARSGDIITLDPQPGYTWGHNVIVHDHTVATDAQKAAVGRRWGTTAEQFFRGAGPIHAIEVDSSWGAGDLGSMKGGYRRDTWYYDEATQQWGYVDPGDEKHGIPPSFQTDPHGPAGDRFHGAYRVRGT